MVKHDVDCCELNQDSAAKCTPILWFKGTQCECSNDFCDATSGNNKERANIFVKKKTCLLFPVGNCITQISFINRFLSTEWVDYVEEPMKYQALRPHVFSMGGWMGVVGWDGVGGGL